MQLTLRQLQIFQAVAQRGTTGAAADRVALSQSAASAALNELERGLGAPLFDRVGKRLVLNEAGRALLPAASAVLDGAQGIESRFAAGSGSTLRDLNLFASSTVGNYVLPRVLARYLPLDRGVRLTLQIGNTTDAVRAVREFATDLGFIEGPCHDPDVVVTPWLRDELVVVAAPGHPLAAALRKGPLPIDRLRDAAWLLREPGSGTREAVEQLLLTTLPNLRSVWTLGSSEAIETAVIEGVGISCLSSAVVRDSLAAKRLVVLATDLPPLVRHFALIHHRDKLLSQPLREFVAFCLGVEGAI